MFPLLFALGKLSVKNCFFVCCNPVRAVSTSSAGHQSLVIKGWIPWEVAVKIGTSHVCTSSFQADTRVWEWAPGRMWRRHCWPPGSPERTTVSPYMDAKLEVEP